jgi:hypothetical protein
MCVLTHSESASDVVRRLQSESTALWPAVLGSLSLRRTRCMRENCVACLSGEQHQSYVLYGRAKGRRCVAAQRRTAIGEELGRVLIGAWSVVVSTE